MSISISNVTAGRIVRIAKKFYEDPENRRKFREWHLKEYGYLPPGEEEEEDEE